MPDVRLYFASIQYWDIPQTLGVGIPLGPEDVIEDALNQRSDLTPTGPLYAKYLSDAMAKYVFRVCIATAFFGVNQHELVMPDLRRKEIDAIDRARQRGDDSRIAEIMRKARERIGWTLGKEYELPAPIVRGDARLGEGPERSYAHMRRGHLRFQPVGPGRQDVKLTFVRPTMVRPDLPFRPSPAAITSRDAAFRASSPRLTEAAPNWLRRRSEGTSRLAGPTTHSASAAGTEAEVGNEGGRSYQRMRQRRVLLDRHFGQVRSVSVYLPLICVCCIYVL